MQRYLNLGGNSGITHYEIATDHVRVWFRGEKSYRYSNAGAGRRHVERMKVLAAAGRGLSTYINKHVHDLYDRER